MGSGTPAGFLVSIEVYSSNREAQAMALRKDSGVEIVPSRRPVDDYARSRLFEGEEDVTMNADRRAGTHVA